MVLRLYPGEYQSDTAATFAEARADFEREWRVFLSKRTESDFQALRDQRDWTARKYALWDTGKALELPAMDRGMPHDNGRWIGHRLQPRYWRRWRKQLLPSSWAFLSPKWWLINKSRIRWLRPQGHPERSH